MLPEALTPEVLRAELVETLRSRGCLRSPAIADAFATVPRHLFVPHVSVMDAYRDRWIVTKRMPDRGRQLVLAARDHGDHARATRCAAGPARSRDRRRQGV